MDEGDIADVVGSAAKVAEPAHNVSAAAKSIRFIDIYHSSGFDDAFVGLRALRLNALGVRHSLISVRWTWCKPTARNSVPLPRLNVASRPASDAKIMSRATDDKLAATRPM
jgi:hypothetical protein